MLSNIRDTFAVHNKVSFNDTLDHSLVLEGLVRRIDAEFNNLVQA